VAYSRPWSTGLGARRDHRSTTDEAISTDVREQVRAALDNIEAALAEAAANSTMWSGFATCCPTGTTGAMLAAAAPRSATSARGVHVGVRLADDRMLIEIEVNRAPDLT